MLGATNDTDGDGLSDALEKLFFHSNPSALDSNFERDSASQDGIVDYPGRGINGVVDGAEDLDGDEVLNSQEIALNKDPFVADSLLPKRFLIYYGTFNLGRIFALRPSAQAVALGDIDGNGQLDMVTVGGGGVDILRNQTFTKLEISPVNGGVRLAWPGWTTGFVPEATTNVLAPNSWIALPGPFAIEEGRYVVTNSLSGMQGYYRLNRAQ